MPTYTYKCTSCENVYDKRKKFTDEHDTDCPVCGKPVRRVINQVGIVFKGSGFYVNDNSGKSSTTVSTAKKTESKPESSSKSAE